MEKPIKGNWQKKTDDNLLQKYFLISILAMVHKKQYTPSLEAEFEQYAWTLDINKEHIKWNKIEIINQQQLTQFGKN